jgi:hypothetical protein
MMARAAPRCALFFFFSNSSAFAGAQVDYAGLASVCFGGVVCLSRCIYGNGRRWMKRTLLMSILSVMKWIPGPALG